MSSRDPSIIPNNSEFASVIAITNEQLGENPLNQQLSNARAHFKRQMNDLQWYPRAVLQMQ